MINTLLLLKNGEIVNIDVPKNTNTDNFNNKSYLQTKTTSKLEQLHYWQLFDETYIIYGCKDGNAGDENKHELPPPIDSSLYFGDLIIFRLDENGKLNHFNKSHYNSFIEHLMGGFIDLDEDEIDSYITSEDGKDMDTDNSYIPSDDSDSDSDSDNNSDCSNESDNKENLSEDEELIDNNILIWGNSKEINTSDDDEEDDDNGDLK